MTDTMPVFALKAQDELAAGTIGFYHSECQRVGLHVQAGEVRKALAEFIDWQIRNPHAVALPDHPHVPAAAPAPREAPSPPISLSSLPWSMRVFDLRSMDKTGYSFSMPDIAISGEDVSIGWDAEAKQLHVVQEQDGLRWEAWGDSRFEAILALMARRWGLVAHFTRAPDEETAGESSVEARE